MKYFGWCHFFQSICTSRIYYCLCVCACVCVQWIACWAYPWRVPFGDHIDTGVARQLSEQLADLNYWKRWYLESSEGITQTIQIYFWKLLFKPFKFLLEGNSVLAIEKSVICSYSFVVQQKHHWFTAWQGTWFSLGGELVWSP